MENFQYSKIKRLPQVDRRVNDVAAQSTASFFFFFFFSLLSLFVAIFTFTLVRGSDTLPAVRFPPCITNNLRQFREADARPMPYGMVLIAPGALSRLSLFIYRVAYN